MVTLGGYQVTSYTTISKTSQQLTILIPNEQALVEKYDLR